MMILQIVEQQFNYKEDKMTTLLKIILPIYLALFFGLALFWRSYVAWRRTGVNPYAFGNGDTVHDYVGKLFRFTLLATALIVLAFFLSESLYNLLMPIPFLDSSLMIGIGLVLLASALIWVLVAQIHMGDSWRIGIDEKTNSPLVQHDYLVFRATPFFSGCWLCLLGWCSPFQL